MGLLALISAFIETISDTVKEKCENQRALEEQRQYENIDWDNIECVLFEGTETAYRIEEEEEFDPEMTFFLTQRDGWQHYETKTVEYEVEDGLNYCFNIRYKDGTVIYRVFHETSVLTERLLEYHNKNMSDIAESFNNVADALGNLFTSQSDKSDYETAFSNFKLMQELYGLNENSTQEDFEKAAEIKMSSLITSDTNNFNQAIYELMLYLLSNKTEGDILEKINKDELSFLQQTDDGIDAFAILPKGKNVDNNVIVEYEKIGIRNDYRKVVILTTGKNISTLHCPDIEVWDIRNICLMYNLAFKKVVTEEAPAERHQKPKERFAVIDFETTGVNYNFRRPPMDEIISVAIIDQDENVIFNTYCDTVKIKSWYEAERANGISPRDVKGYPTFVEIMPKVIEILLSYDYVISYNVPFEKSFLENYAYLYTPTDFSVSKIKWGDDPMRMFMEYMGSRKFLKLETAAEHFGYKYNAHDALEDTKAALYVYNALREE